MSRVASFSFSHTHLPRYVQVAETLMREIREGYYPVGTLLPPEPQLCERFGVSRHTVREAVRLLCEQGLVSRQQGIGTRVLARQMRQRYVASLSSLHDLMAYAQRTRLRCLDCRWTKADGALAQCLRCARGELWLELEACRYPVDGGDPIVYMRIFTRPECDGIQHVLDQSDAWVYGLIEKFGGERILGAEQVVSAIEMPERGARVLGVLPGSPGLFVRRYYVGQDSRLLSVSLNYYPVDRFEITTRWHLEG